MASSTISAIVSSCTTGLLALITWYIRRLVKNFGTFRAEHRFLMQTTRQNTEVIKRILRHLEMED